MSNSLQSLDRSLPGSSVHGILQARILEWAVIPFSRGSSQPGIKLEPPALQAYSLPSKPGDTPVSLPKSTSHWFFSVLWSLNGQVHPSSGQQPFKGLKAILMSLRPSPGWNSCCIRAPRAVNLCADTKLAHFRPGLFALVTEFSLQSGYFLAFHGFPLHSIHCDFWPAKVFVLLGVRVVF